MYVDKPMRGHGLMQAIARVNRVFRDKPGGLVVDYLGPRRRAEGGAGHLHRERRHGQDRARPGRGRRGDAGEVRGLLRPVPRLRLVEVDDRHARRSGWRCCPRRRSTSSRRRTARTGCSQAVTRAVAGVRAGRAARGGAAHPRRRGLLPGRAGRARQARAGRGAGPRRSSTTRSARSSPRRGVRGGGRHLRRRRAEEAGHLDPVGRVPGRGARTCRSGTSPWSCCEAAEGRDPARARGKNVVQARSFAEMLEQSIRRYQNRAIEAAQVIEELIELAKEMREADAARRGARA